MWFPWVVAVLGVRVCLDDGPRRMDVQFAGVVGVLTCIVFYCVSVQQDMRAWTFRGVAYCVGVSCANVSGLVVFCQCHAV